MKLLLKVKIVCILKMRLIIWIWKVNLKNEITFESKSSLHFKNEINNFILKGKFKLKLETETPKYFQNSS